MSIDVQKIEDRVVVKILKNPESLEELNKFLELHSKILNETKILLLVLFDVRELKFDFIATTVYLPIVVSHFIRMRQISDAKLMGCSVCVSNAYNASSIIQKIVDSNPGKVPTFINEDEKKCKQFLTGCRKTNKKKLII